MHNAMAVVLISSFLGGLIAHPHALRADDPSAKPSVIRTRPELPETVLERMQVPVTAKILLPLEQAFTEIFAAVDVKCVVDGNSLKHSGITRNEMQQLSLQDKPLHEVIQKILDRTDRTQTYPDIALVIDEKQKLVTVTTREFAKSKNLSIVDFDLLKGKQVKGQ